MHRSRSIFQLPLDFHDMSIHVTQIPPNRKHTTSGKFYIFMKPGVWLEGRCHLEVLEPEEAIFGKWGGAGGGVRNVCIL